MGKTLQVVSLVDANPRTTWTVNAVIEEVGATLIVCTRETRTQWLDTIEKFGIQDNQLTVLEFGGTRSSSDLTRASVRHADVVLVDYHVALHEFNYSSRDAPRVTRQGQADVPCSILCQVQFQRVVVDEVQYMENGGQAQCVIREMHGAHHWAVSATPLKNGVASLTRLFEFVSPGYLTAGGWHSLVTAYNAGDAGAAEALIAFIKPAILRRHKSILGLPEKHSVLVDVQLSAAEIAVHGCWIAANICKGIEAGATFSEVEMLSMARSYLVDPSIVIRLADRQRRGAASMRSTRRERLRGESAGAGVVGGYAQNLAKIASSLIKLRGQVAPPMLQQLVALKEQELNKQLLPLARVVDASLEDLHQDEFAQMCDGTAKDVTLMDGMRLLDLLAPQKAHVFERAMENSDRIKSTDLRGCECLICCESINNDQEAELTCWNLHPFHVACLLQWRSTRGDMGEDATCPTCRVALPPSQPRSAAGMPPSELEASRPARLLTQRAEHNSRVIPSARSAAMDVALLRTLMLGQPAGDLSPLCSSKVATLLSILRGEHTAVFVAPADKVIVYVVVDDALPTIRRHLVACKPPISCVALNKDVGALDAFRDPTSGVKVLLIKASLLSSSGMGAAGLDLPVANTVILMDEMPCDLSAQCFDRVHRIGQTRETTVVQISARDSVDKPLRELYRHLGKGATLGAPALKDVCERTRMLTTVRLQELAGEGGMQLEAVEDGEAAEEVQAAADDGETGAEEEATQGEVMAVEAEAQVDENMDEEVEAEAEADGEAEDDAEDEQKQEGPPAKRLRRVPTEVDVAGLARQLGLSAEICDALEENLVNDEVLFNAPDEDLIKEVGISRLQLRRLRMELERA